MSCEKHGRRAKSLFCYELDKIGLFYLRIPRCSNLFLWLLKLFDPFLSSSILKRVFYKKLFLPCIELKNKTTYFKRLLFRYLYFKNIKIAFLILLLYKKMKNIFFSPFLKM
ncbi:hypothetical protein NEOC84_000475|nr:hypothetical protein [Neochlamydia sp. AcF84]